jgi:hypothetical protein
MIELPQVQMTRVENRLDVIRQQCGDDDWHPGALAVTDHTARAVSDLVGTLMNSEAFHDLANITLTPNEDGSVIVTADRENTIVEFTVWQGRR